MPTRPPYTALTQSRLGTRFAGYFEISELRPQPFLALAPLLLPLAGAGAKLDAPRLASPAQLRGAKDVPMNRHYVVVLLDSAFSSSRTPLTRTTADLPASIRPTASALAASAARWQPCTRRARDPRSSSRSTAASTARPLSSARSGTRDSGTHVYDDDHISKGHCRPSKWRGRRVNPVATRTVLTGGSLSRIRRRPAVEHTRSSATSPRPCR